MRDAGFNFFHKIIIVHIIYFVVKLLNAVPTKLGISQQHALVEIVMGWKLDAKEDLRIRFGAYVEATHYSIITNNMLDMTHP